MRLADREKVAGVAEEIDAGPEVGCGRRNLQLEFEAILRRFVARLELQHLPRRRRRSAVPVGGLVRDADVGHGAEKFRKGNH